MRQLKVLLTYFVIVFGGAAVLAPIVYNGVQELSRNNIEFWKVDQLADYLGRHPFHRYVNRCLLGLALIGLPALLKELKIPGWKEIGLQWPSRRNLAFAGAAFLVGSGILTVVAAFAVGAGARTLNLDYSTSEVFRHFKNAILAALLVSIVEELLFRGVLFKAFRKTGSFVRAAFLSSAIYAMLHFFNQPESPGRIGPYSGLFVLGQMISGFFSMEKLVPAFLNLVIVGVILSLAFERTRSLYFSMGMHAAFILWGKSFGFFTRQTPGVADSLWGSNRLIDGWLPLILLLLLLVFLDRILPKVTLSDQPVPPPLQHEPEKQPVAI